MSNGDWFAPKKFGYGAGLPIAWQGWALLIGFLAMTIGGAMLLAPRHPIVFVAALVPLTLAFMLICAQHTRGGWKWRSGGE